MREYGRCRARVARSRWRSLAPLLAVAATVGLASLVLAPLASPSTGDPSQQVATPWVTSAQPTGTASSVNVLDDATFPSSVGLAVAQLHVWGQASGPVSLVSEIDGLYSVEFPVSGLRPGRYLASVSWTPLIAGATTSWSSPVLFTVGGPICSQPAVSVSLPGVDVSYSTHTTKPWGVRYLPLGLTFAPTSASSSSTCSLLATGTLNVQIGLRLVQNEPQITIPVDSVATAELDFLRPDATAGIPTCDWVTVKLDCSLDGVSGNVLRWHTEGFSEQLQLGGTWVQVFNSGPLTFYDSVSPSLSFSEQVQTAETAFHLDLIAHLQDINPLYVIQEPPAHLSVTDSTGRVTGIAGDGRVVRQIPGSVSVEDGAGYSAVVLLTPRGPYTVTASGPTSSSYSLTMDELARAGTSGLGQDRAESTAGRFTSSGRVSVCLQTDGPRCSSSLPRLPAVIEYPSSRVIAPRRVRPASRPS
jgi:hypothetical protein